jgi:hypothetical protein
MPDLVEFLTTRLNEEQRLAEWAAKPHLGPQEPGDTAVWQVEEWVPSEHEEGAVPAAIWVTDRSEMGIGQMRPDRGIAAHIAYWDPARVLADIAAKRAIVEVCTVELRMGCSTAWSVLLRLAAPYTEHPDFDPAWRIDA